MIVEYRYSRSNNAWPEYRILDTLATLKPPSIVGCYLLETSTASTFNLVRAWCYLHRVPLKAYYEGELLPLDSMMRMKDWNKYPDFNIAEEALEVLMTPNDPAELKKIRKRLEGYL